MRILLALILLMTPCCPVLAQSRSDVYKVKFPVTVATPKDRIAYAYQAQEALRLQHNETGKKFNEKEITKEEWEAYEQTIFRPKQDAISLEVLKAKDELKNSKEYTIDLEKDIEKVTD